MKRGLVLEGGAMRVLFSAGVMDVMMENGITFDGIIGVSAGAAFGCNYKSHQAGRALRYNVRFAHDWRFCSMRSWLTTGDLCGAEFAYRVLPKHLDIFDEEAFEADGTSFYVVATDIETGNPVYKPWLWVCPRWVRLHTLSSVLSLVFWVPSCPALPPSP